jgi:xylose isomerase
METVKYSAIIGSLGQTFDRFMPGGYKDPGKTYVEFDDILNRLEETGVLQGVDLYQAETGPLSDPEIVNEMLSKKGFEVASMFPLLFGERRWAKGSLTAADPETRKQALDLVRKNIDFNAKLNGSPSVNLWLGQDGFDYPMQANYTKQYDYMIKGLRELADYNPDVKISIEGKLREPRNRCIVDTTLTAVLMCMEVDRENVGVAIDTGHVFCAQQNVAQNVEIAARYNKLFMMHVNDNYNTWDDDLIAGSFRYTDFIEMFYSLRKVGYNGFMAIDIFPYREDSILSTVESVKNLKKMDAAVDLIGYDTIAELIEEGDANKTNAVVREAVFK